MKCVALREDGLLSRDDAVCEAGYFKAVVVKWDNGIRVNYRAEVEGAADLRVLDNAPAGIENWLTFLPHD